MRPHAGPNLFSLSRTIQTRHVTSTWTHNERAEKASVFSLLLLLLFSTTTTTTAAEAAYSVDANRGRADDGTKNHLE